MKKVTIKTSPLKENNQSLVNTKRRNSVSILKSKKPLSQTVKKAADPVLVEKLFKILIYLAKKENIMELKRQKLC